MDNAVRVDDVGGAVGGTGGVFDAQGPNEIMLDVRKHGEGNLFELRVGGAPVEVAEFVIGASTQHLGVAVFEVFVELAKGRNLGGADEGEVLRVEEHDLPLAFVFV